MGKIVGYARVSSREQNLDRQLIALSKYVQEDMIVTDKASGKDFNRPGYQSLKIGIGKLVKGDTLYVKSLDRFSRNKEEAKKELQYFSGLGIRVKILDIPSTMADIAEGLAAMPLDKATGKKVSKKTGRCIGRPSIQFPENFAVYYDKWKQKEITAVNAMKALGLKPNSFYKLAHQYEEGFFTAISK